VATTLTYLHIEWHAILSLLGRPDAITLTDSELLARISNEVGRAWLAGRRDVGIHMSECDAVVIQVLRSALPDAETLAAIAEAESIIRMHQRR